jgi:DNA-binding transcriptional LysR family regulator
VDWNDLRYFLVLARTGTLTGAARELGVEHTTVGRRLAALEAALEARLFTRGPSGLSLTEAGNTIRCNVEVIAEQVATIERRIAGVDARIEGLVRLTIPGSVDGYFVQAIRRLRALYPNLTIDLLSDDRRLDIRRGDADIAVRFGEVGDPDLVARKLGSGGWALYASRDYVARKGLPRSISDLHGHDVIGYNDSVADVIGARWLRDHAVGSNLVLRANGTTTVTSAVVAGLGLAPLPCIIGNHEVELVRLSAELVGACSIVLVVHPDLTSVARIRATIEFIVEGFERDALLWSGLSVEAA